MAWYRMYELCNKMILGAINFGISPSVSTEHDPSNCFWHYNSPSNKKWHFFQLKLNFAKVASPSFRASSFQWHQGSVDSLHRRGRRGSPYRGTPCHGGPSSGVARRATSRDAATASGSAGAAGAGWTDIAVTWQELVIVGVSHVEGQSSVGLVGKLCWCCFYQIEGWFGW